MVEMGYEGRALAFHHCAHLSEMDFEYVEVVAIWGYVFVDINVVNENLAPFLIFFFIVFEWAHLSRLDTESHSFLFLDYVHFHGCKYHIDGTTTEH